MPAKFAKTTKDFEVFGFHSRQRRAYINLCMRYGLPPREHFQERWITRELSRKSDKEFRAYSHTFMTHLCEPRYFTEKIQKIIPLVPMVLTSLWTAFQRKIYLDRESSTESV